MMPYLNNRQFLDAGYAGEEWVSDQAKGRSSAGPKVRFPSQQQMALPGLGGGAEQMRLFDTQRAGPSNVYTANPSSDAADWRDADKQVPLDADQQEFLSDHEAEQSGQLMDFQLGEDARAHIAYGGAHTEAVSQAKQAGTHLGHDAYPGQPHQDLKFGDLWMEDDVPGAVSWYASDNTKVGGVRYHESEWGPQVDAAEINPMYRGRGFSREAIPDFARHVSMDTPGVVHAGSYTADGERAFHMKGVPTEDDIDRGFEDFAGSFGENEDEDFVRDEYLMNLEAGQEELLAQLPGRRSSFAQGWRPTYKHGRQEELPGMPQKYTGGR